MRLFNGELIPELSDDLDALEAVAEKIGDKDDINIGVEAGQAIGHDTSMVLARGMKSLLLDRIDTTIPEGEAKDQMLAMAEVLSDLALDGMVASKRVGRLGTANAVTRV